MKASGITLLVIGLLLEIAALNMNVVVDSTYNLHLGSNRLMAMMLGIGSFLGGAVLFGFGTVHEKKAGPITNETIDNNDEASSNPPDPQLTEEQIRFNNQMAIYISIGTIIGGLLLFYVATR